MTDNSNGLIMPVSPMYGNNGGWGGFGGDWGSLIVLFLIAAMFGGFGGGFGGFGGFNGGLGFDFPWLLNGQSGINANTNNGFQNALLNDNITSVRDGISSLATQMCNGFGNVSTQLCDGFNGVVSSINGAQNALAQQMYTNQIADLERSYAAQTANSQGMSALQAQLAQCCCDNRLATAQTQALVQSENCQDRFVAQQNTRDIIESQNRNSQAILDKLCALELDGYKRENDNLRTQLNMATLNASQAAQTATFQQGLNDEVDALYNRLNNCPVATVPVYGRQPIFTCNGNNGCGCGNF